MVRYDSNGNENTRIIVPVEMGQKEKFIQMLEGDPLADKSIQISLPRISYTLNGLKYNANRKQQTTLMNYAKNNTGGVATQYVPVPYDLDFSVYIYVRNIEDGTQIIEQILPFFTPDYTLRIILSPALNIIKDVPITLNDVEYDVDNEGNKNGQTRIVIWTLNFTAQGWIFGPADLDSSGIIKETITNLYNSGSENQNINLVMNKTSGNGIYQIGEVVYQSNSDITYSTATATVSHWSPNTGQLFITNIDGNFITNMPVMGVTTHASYLPINYEIGNSY